MHKHYDYIIVGQGLAGTCLGYQLEQRHKKCLFIDNPQEVASTDVAAGIMNPITGRKYVKSWRIAELLPFAKQFYQHIEQETGLNILHEQILIRSLFSPADENQWLMRSGDPSYTPFMQDQVQPGEWMDSFDPPLAYGGVRQAAQVDIAEIVSFMRNKWINNGCFLQSDFRHEDLSIETERVHYQEYSANKIVFCEGWRVHQNPYFNHLPFRGSKGEVLLIKIPHHSIGRIVKHKLFIVPLKNDIYWVGSTNNNHFKVDEITPEGRARLEQRLSETLTVPYEIIKQRAAIRPTVKDRRPIIGQHSEFSSLFIFNGLGTKGTSIAPLLADEMICFLEDQKELDEVVNLKRFN